MSRSAKFNAEEMEDSFKVHRAGNARKKIAALHDKLRRQRKRSLRAFNEKELRQEYAQENL